MTQRLAAGASRRALLAGALGGILGGLAGLTRQAADAQTRQSNGSTCTRATRCASLKCADGVCCNSNCTGQCESCATGACLPVSGAPVGNHPACTGIGVCQASCDGVTPTHCTAYPGLDVVCADPVCEGGWLTTYGRGGDGACHPTTTSCAPFGCDATGTARGTGCTGDADCAEGTSCVGGQCVPERPIGDPCTLDAECASGFCVDGVCCTSACESACGGQGQVCCLSGCHGGLECDHGSRCVSACGGQGETCCLGRICDTGLDCSVFSNLRGECGGLGEACCFPASCDFGYRCLQGICRVF